MNYRNELAGRLYQTLIASDPEAALEHPARQAQRALLLADAFMVCIFPSTPEGVEAPAHCRQFTASIDLPGAALRISAQCDQEHPPYRVH